MAGNRDPQRRPVLYDLRNQRLLADPAIGSKLIPVAVTDTFLSPSDIGVTVQGYDATLLNAADIGVTVQGYDATLLNADDIGVTVQGYDATLLNADDIGATVQGYDATLLNSADIGDTVQGYDANTAKTDAAQTFTAGQRGGVTALVNAVTIAVDFNSSNFFSITLTGSSTLGNPSNLVAGQSGAIFITQDGTGGHTLAYDTYWDFSGGTAPTLSSAMNAVDVLVYMVRSATSVVGHLITDVK